MAYRLGYEKIHIIDPDGRAGGIWVLRSSSLSGRIDLVDVNPRMVTLRLTRGNTSCCFTSIYAYPYFPTRVTNWTHIRELRRRIFEPWALVGDWNEILGPSEVEGGDFVASRADEFGRLLLECDLSTIHTTRSLFTWKRSAADSPVLLKRLDRGVVDASWKTAFPDSYVEVLFNGCSDHNPLILRCNTQRGPAGPPLFRWFDAWTTHDSYGDLVASSWAHGQGGLRNRLAVCRMLPSCSIPTPLGILGKKA